VGIGYFVQNVLISMPFYNDLWRNSERKFPQFNEATGFTNDINLAGV